MLRARRSNPVLLLACFVAALLAGCSRRAPEPWQEVRLATDARFNGVWFTDSLNGWLAGGARTVPGGLLGRTRDGGRTWHVRSDAVPGMGDGFHLGGIQFRDSLNGCAVGSGGLVLLTGDGGASWRRVRRGRSPTDHLSRLQLLDDRDGWALGPATLIATHDGGETWKDLVRNREETGYLSGRAIAFVSGWRGWLVSHGGILMRTEDGGLSWSPVPLPFPHGMRPTLNDITFADRSHGWFVGEQGTVGHTADGGETWALQSNGVPLERVLPKGEKPRPPDIMPGLDDGPSRLELTAVRFADPERGFALGHYADVGESVILGTRDGGATWATERVAPGQYLHALFVLDRRHAWAAGDRTRRLPQALYRYAGPE